MTQASDPGAPETFTRTQLDQRALYRRAVEAVIWGMPVVNFERLLGGFVKAGGAPNQVPYWSRLLDGKNQTLTPNPDIIYFNPFYDTKAGPVVLEIPPAGDAGSITGSIDDGWQNALEDVGPAGADKGAGGKYLILPPDHQGVIPDGYIPVQSDTWRGFVILRSNVKSGADADVAAAVAYGKQIKLYPLSQAGASPPTTLLDMSDTVYDATIPYDRTFFQALAHAVDYEPWLPRDRAMIDPLRSLGIVKGRPFAPTPEVAAILDAAAREAHAYIDAHYEDVFTPGFYPDGRWALPANPEVVKGLQGLFPDPDSYPTDGRAVSYSMAYFSAKHLGQGQFYLMAIRDRDGQPFDGSAAYRLRVPPKAPVSLYWSATVYDRATHALLPDAPRASRASTSPGLAAEADGSIDLWFASAAPAGKESNWVPTAAGRGFEVLFRLYGPQKAFFDKAWVLPDIERVG